MCAGPAVLDSFASEQQKDPTLKEIIIFLKKEELPLTQKRAWKIALQTSLFAIEDYILFYINSKQQHRKRVIVPRHLQEPILKENHCNVISGQFSGRKTYGALVHR